MAFKKARLAMTQERDHKIETMNFPELIDYLCLKNGKDPKKCDGCPGIKGCRAGQRAIVLLNEMELEKLKQSADIGANRKGNKLQKQAVSRKKFIQAMNQPNMIQYLMDTYGNTRNCARENLKHWAKIFPDLAEQYKFEEKFAGLTLCHKTVMTGSAAEKQKNAKEAYAEALLQDDPIAYVMEKFGTDRAHALQRFGNWKRRYGKKEEEKVDTEEVSIEDFLMECESATQHTEKSAEEHEEPEKQNPVCGTQNQFIGDLKAKYKELDAEKERLKDRIAWIEKAQDALAMTLNVFNPDSAIAKGIFGE